MSAINAKASRKMKKYAVLTREPRCFLGSLAFSWEQRKWINTVDISTNMVDPKSGKYDLLPHVAPGNIESFKRLVIHENGDVLVTVEGKEQTVDTIPDFPPRPAWDDLCVLAREDDISAEVRGQELAVSWP